MQNCRMGCIESNVQAYKEQKSTIVCHSQSFSSLSFLKPTQSNYWQYYHNAQSFKTKAQRITNQDIYYSNRYHTQANQFLQNEGRSLVGLPNLGNTCFLNSAMQFLFGATDFREFIIQKSQVFNQFNRLPRLYQYIVFLGNLFSSLKKQTDFEGRQKYLKKLLKKLQNSNLLYQANKQEDALDILINILNQIEHVLSIQQTLKRFFGITVSIKCLCLQQFCIYQSLYLSRQQQICSKCQKIFQKKYITTPNYLILVNNQQNNQQLQLENDKYQFVSAIVYVGNGKYGHYTCIRIQNGKMYQFNDEMVNQYYKRSNNSLIKVALYKKSQPLSNQNFGLQKEKDKKSKQRATNSQINIDKIFFTQINVPKYYISLKQCIGYSKRDLYFKIKSVKPIIADILNHDNFTYYKNNQSGQAQGLFVSKMKETEATNIKIKQIINQIEEELIRLFIQSWNKACNLKNLSTFRENEIGASFKPFITSEKIIRIQRNQKK